MDLLLLHRIYELHWLSLSSRSKGGRFVHKGVCAYVNLDKACMTMSVSTMIVNGLLLWRESRERNVPSDDEEWAYKNEFHAADGQCSFKTDINK